MEVFFLSFLIICVVAFGMAVGVLVRGSELKGTCATLNGTDYASIACESCPARIGQSRSAPRDCPRRDQAMPGRCRSRAPMEGP